MKTAAIFVAALASLVAALPTDTVEQRQAVPVCLGTTGNAQCCATDVLNLLDLNCFNPPTTPTSTANFRNICADRGQQAKCCALPILGQDLICADPV